MNKNMKNLIGTLKEIFGTLTIQTITLLSCIGSFFLGYHYQNHKNIEPIKQEEVIQTSEVVSEKKDTLHSVKMFHCLEKYSKQYNIPKHIVYNIAFKETGYRGPKDKKYKPNRTSSAGAVGPMQVMPSTANLVHKKKVSPKKLKNDIEFNTRTSVILLSKLYKKYKDWEIVCGCYNTGKPMVNQYAQFCANQTDYKKNWKKS